MTGVDVTLDDDTIRLLLDAGPGVREYAAKVVGKKPIGRAIENWRDDHPDALEALRDDPVAGVINLVSPAPVVDNPPCQPPTRVEQQFLDAVRDAVFEEIRDAQRRLALTPAEFVVYLLSQAAGWSDDAIADELDAPVDDVERTLADARESFRTSMRTLDLCERVDDPELDDDLRAWRFHRDPVCEPLSRGT